MPMLPTAAYLALGSNLGDRQANLDAAIARLRASTGVEVVRVSSALENPAVGGPANSPAFLNAAAEIRTVLSAHALLERLLEIERELGRVRRDRWEPRVIDLDVLLFGNEIISTGELTIPHPRMHERRFVLEPLAEIAPGVVHPVRKVTIAKLLEELQR
jgi:2-amino-4-hydroxy-6-hydroxymethyldihydropteridine diphosphokinase